MGLKMEYALVNTETNLVDNVIVLEDGAEWAPPENFVLVPLQPNAGIGDTWDGTSFIKPPPPPEEEVVQPISTGAQVL